MATNPIESIEVETPAEAETAPPLPIYGYFNMVPPAERTVPTPPPDEWLELHRAQAPDASARGAKTKPETVVETPDDTSPPKSARPEVPSFGADHSGYFDGDTRYSQPAETTDEASELAAAVIADTASEDTPADSPELLAPDEETEVPPIKVNAGIMALKGIGRRLQPFGQAAKNRLRTVTELVTSTRMPEIDTKKYAETAARIGGAAIEAFNFRGEENKNKRHRLYKLGGAVVGLALVAGGGYFAQKYAPEIVHSHSSPEAGPVDPGHFLKPPGGADNPLFAHHLTLTDHAHAVTVQAGHHLHKAGNALHTAHQHAKNIGHQIGKLNLNLNDYSYNIADKLDHKHATQLLSKAMKVLGLGAHYTGKGPDTQIAMANGRIINPQQMHQLNEIIVRLGSH